MPARRHQPGRAGHRPRLPGVVGQVHREDLALVRRDHHVVLGRALGEDRHLRLDLHRAGIGAPGAAGVLEDPLLDDLRAELLRRPPVGVGQRLVLGVAALDQEPVGPALPAPGTAPARRSASRPTGATCSRFARQSSPRSRSSVAVAFSTSALSAGDVGELHRGRRRRPACTIHQTPASISFCISATAVSGVADDRLGGELLLHEACRSWRCPPSPAPRRRSRGHRAAGRAARSAAAGSAHPPAAPPPGTPSPPRAAPPASNSSAAATQAVRSPFIRVLPAGHSAMRAHGG